MPRRVLPVILLAILCQCSQPEPLAPALPVEQKPAAVTEAVHPAPKPRPRVYHEEAPIHMPAPLCYQDEVVPGIKVDLKYCGNDNFVGRPIQGYTTGRRANRQLLRNTMAAASMRNYSKEWWHYYLSPPGLCHRYDFPLNDQLNQKIDD